MNLTALIRTTIMTFRPDSFRNDPYGYVTNQIGHAFMVGGVLFVYAVVMGVFWITGEFPPKWGIIAGGSITYAAYELLAQGWRGGDTVEDWWFVSVYGITGPVVSFTEMTPGSMLAVFDMRAALPFIVLLSVHIAFGAWLRSRK
jgi:hypothetical protein